MTAHLGGHGNQRGETRNTTRSPFINPRRYRRGGEEPGRPEHLAESRLWSHDEALRFVGAGLPRMELGPREEALWPKRAAGDPCVFTRGTSLPKSPWTGIFRQTYYVLRTYVRMA